MKSAFLFLVLAGLVRSGSASCANDCSGNGRCNAHSACECYRNWMGNDCSQRVCFFGRAFVDTPAGDLNSDGKVGADQNVMSMSGNTPSHELFDESYSLGDVSVGSFDEAHFYAECSGKGSCQRESGLCECFTGYEGEGCTRVSCASSTGETCSGHGVCLRLSDSNSGPMRTYSSWDSHKTQQCNCDPLYTGIACDQRSCPSGDDPVTKFEHVTMLCGSWGLESQVKQTGKDPSQQINTAAYENLEVFGTVSGASAKLSFFCGVKSSDVESRKLSTKAENIAEMACNALKTEDGCDNGASCDWQAAVTRTTPEFNEERCITVQGVKGLFTISDYIVLGDSTYLLNDTVRIAHKYHEELKQANEVQTVVVRGAECDRASCVYEKMTGQCKPAAAGAELGFQSAAVATCGTASAGSESPLLTSESACVPGEAGCSLCAAIKYNTGVNCGERNPFALTFVDEYGSSFTTRSIECADYDSSYPKSGTIPTVLDAANVAWLAERMATAEHCRSMIESALEDLPNSALVDVDVRDQKTGVVEVADATSIITWVPSGFRDTDDLKDHFLDVSFISNTGDVTMMTVVGQDTEKTSSFMHHATYYTQPDVFISEKAKGTTDNYICSNRGVCDYSTGTCKCFQGFTRQDCSLQNVLAMY